MSAIDQTFERIFDEMRAMRADLKSETAAIRGDISALQRQVTQIVFGFAVGLLGVLAAGVGAAIAVSL